LAQGLVQVLVPTMDEWDPFLDPADEVALDPAAKPSLRRIRVLVLHGGCSNARVMGFQLTRLAKRLDGRVDLVYVNGPLVYPDDSSAVEEQRTIFKGIASELKFYSFHQCLQTGHGQYGERSDDGLGGVLTYLQNQIRINAPIDGVLGFSEGANAASVLAAQSATGAGATLNFAVHLCPGRPQWAKQRAELFKDRLPLPSLHVSGSQDIECPNENALRDLYEDPVCIMGDGDHKPIPATSSAEADRICDAIAEFLIKQLPVDDGQSA